METIKSRQNPKITEISALLRDRKLRKSSGFFVVEGVKCCLEAIEAGLAEELYITPQCLEKHPELAKLRYLTVEEHVYDRITLLKSPEGVCARCRVHVASPQFEKGARYVVLCDIQNPDNAGAMIRTAAAFGFDGVVSCGGVDLTSPKLLRAAAGAAFVIPLYEAEVQQVFELAALAGITTVATSPTAPTSLRDCRIDGGIAIFIGNEGNGLSDETIEQCDESVRIELSGLESLNAAVSAGIVMYHFG